MLYGSLRERSYSKLLTLVGSRLLRAMGAKAQIDWIALNVGAVRPTQGKTMAVMEVSGGSQSCNAVNQLRILARWMRMITIPNQSSVAKASMEFDEACLEPRDPDIAPLDRMISMDAAIQNLLLAPTPWVTDLG